MLSIGTILFLLNSISQIKTLISVNKECIIASDNPIYDEFKKEFQLIEQINNGTLATVNKYQSNSQINCIYAVKEFRSPDQTVTAITNELSIYTRIQDTSFSPILYGTVSFLKEEKICFLMFLEFISNFDLFEFLAQNNYKLSSSVAQFISAQVALAIQFLHSIEIVHLDIKLENVMIDKSGSIKLVDFGFSQQLNSKRGGCMKRNRSKGKLSGLVGTIFYNAPEIMQEKLYDHRVDWYAFGALVYFLHGGEMNREQNFADLRYRILKQTSSVGIGEEILQVVLKCTEPRAGNRTSGLKELMEMPYFSTIQWNKLENKELEPPTELKEILNRMFQVKPNSNVCLPK